jgi:hypothetical protein
MSTQEIARRKREERARKLEYDDAKIAIFKSQFKEDDRRINDEDSYLAVEYYVDERGDPIRNVYLKNAKENLDPLRKVEAQGYRYEEMLSPEEKELAYGLYKPLPEKLRRKLGVTIKAGKRIRHRHHKKTRKGKGKSKGNSKSKSKGKGNSNSKSNSKKRYSFNVKR